MPDYRTDDSVPEKRLVIEATYEDQVPGYLLFHMGEAGRPTDEEEQKLNDIFFNGENRGFGSKELHRSGAFTGSYLQRPDEDLQPFVVLRIRGASKMVYSFKIGDETCHLIQASNGDGSKPVINFLEMWGPSIEDKKKSDDDYTTETPRDPWGRQTSVMMPESLTFVVSIPSDEEPPQEQQLLNQPDVKTSPASRSPVARFVRWLFS